MRRPLTLVPIASVGILFVAAGSAAAQQFVVPSHFTSAVGNWTDGAGLDGPARVLQVHNDVPQTPMTLTQLAVRRDPFDQLTRTGWTVQLDVYVSTAATTPATANPIFAMNHGPDKTQVLSQFQPVSLPANAPRLLSTPFEFVVKFTLQPFAWSGAGDLCWEVRDWWSDGGQQFDAVRWPQANPAPAVHAFGTGCTAAGQSAPMALGGWSGANWPTGVTLGWNASNMPAAGGQPTLVHLMIGGVTTPFRIPGTSCFAYGSYPIVLARLAQNGQMNTSVPVPVSPSHNGASLISQIVAMSPNANPTGIVTSNAVQHHVVAPYSTVPTAQVVSSNPWATSGFVRAAYGVIVQF